MNSSLIILEIAVVALGLALLLLDLWSPEGLKPKLGYVAAFALGFIFLFSFSDIIDTGAPAAAFGGMYVQDGISLFFKRLFLLAAITVLILSVEFADRFPGGITEYYSLVVFALAGMMFASSANDFALLFVSVELITVTFYVLTSFQRNLTSSLEAGIKYLILGALSSALMIFGIAFVFGTTGELNFERIAAVNLEFSENPLFLGGLVLILAGLGFKIAVFPLQLWAPDVYQGSPTPTTAFLAIGSKAAGFVLLLRVLFTAVPDVAVIWDRLLMTIAGATILYGNLCAIPQRNLKRLLGYSSIAHAGYLMLGIAALTETGQSAVLFYLGVYLFSVLAAFGVMVAVFRQGEDESITALAGLHRRSPFLAATLSLALISLAGVPPLAGFFGKFMLLSAVVEKAPQDPAYSWLLLVAIAGVVISLYYYLNVVRAVYWSKTTENPAPVSLSLPLQWALGICVLGMLGFGLAPGLLVRLSQQAVAAALPF